MRQLVQPAAQMERTIRVIAWLCSRMQAGTLRAGDQIPSEPELAEAAKVSTGCARDAVACLCILGIFHRRADTHVVFADDPSPLLFDLVAALCASRPPELQEAHHVAAIHLAGLAAQRATQDDHTAMAEEVAEMYAATAPGDHLEHARRFHRAIVRSAGNSLLAAFAEALMVSGSSELRGTLDMRESARLHGEIYRAIRRRQPEEAKKAMEEHFRVTFQTPQHQPCMADEPHMSRRTGT